MKLYELKSKVFKLAEVNTTKQLKTRYEEIRVLDLRYKVSWEKALIIIQSKKGELEDWLNNPPEEYRELFAEIETTLERFDKKLVKVKRLSKDINLIANDLDELAEECQDEAKNLEHEVELTHRISKQAELN
ncbi:hypothetical protein [Fischerella sp. PCC 9605]|uniref:hypothetical protein n=1 Tax=Fischerella sp. PCC 9605 TaxID=1173024 RepID=UPI00047DFA40|nr:hypothetical protein [Fischerella sp. PCC 9605]